MTNGSGSVNRTYSSANFDTPRDNIDDISSTLTHTSDQDINNVGERIESRENPQLSHIYKGTFIYKIIF